MKHATWMTLAMLGLLAGGCGAQKVLLGTESSYVFVASDALALPGESVDIAAQLRAGDFLQGAAGHPVRFFRGGEFYKVAETDTAGVATVAFTPPRPGNYPFRAEVVATGLEDDPPSPATFYVVCRKADEPIVIVDLDKTIVASGFHTVLIGSPAPMANSQDVLKRLGRKHTIVYLTHRPDLFGIKSRQFLDDRGYPFGPLLLSSVSGFMKGSGAFKSGELAELRKRFKNVRIGIGDKLSDAQAYHENGLRAFLIIEMPHADEPEPYEELANDLDALDKQIEVVARWRQIEKALFDGESYPRADMQTQLYTLADDARRKLRDVEDD
ncbi:MAG: hypothetical protein GVY16_07470 [Planctomycetes bacterium]|nr:hypothetical protein [Planctomycetota bacterium]